VLLQACVKTDPNKVVGGVLPDVVHRLYQDISVLSMYTLSWYTLKNVISFKPMRRVCDLLCRKFMELPVLNSIMFRFCILNLTQMGHKMSVVAINWFMPQTISMAFTSLISIEFFVTSCSCVDISCAKFI